MCGYMGEEEENMNKSPKGYQVCPAVRRAMLRVQTRA